MPTAYSIVFIIHPSICINVTRNGLKKKPLSDWTSERQIAQWKMREKMWIDISPRIYNTHVSSDWQVANKHMKRYPTSSAIQFSSVQSLSRVRLFVTPWIAAHQASQSITNSRSSLRLTSIKSVMPSSHFILCCPLLLLPPIPPSIRVFFQWVSSSHQVAKVLEFHLQHQSFQWTPRTDLL